MADRHIDSCPVKTLFGVFERAGCDVLEHPPPSLCFIFSNSLHLSTLLARQGWTELSDFCEGSQRTNAFPIYSRAKVPIKFLSKPKNFQFLENKKLWSCTTDTSIFSHLSQSVSCLKAFWMLTSSEKVRCCKPLTFCLKMQLASIWRALNCFDLQPTSEVHRASLNKKSLVFWPNSSK